jgi:hypothetical protein
VGAGDGFGFVFFEPGQHRQGPGGIGAVQRGGDDHVAGGGVQGGGLLGAALVVPHDGWADDGAGGIGQNRDMGTGGNADTSDAVRLDAGRGNGARHRGAKGCEPFGGVLFRPAKLRDMGGDGGAGLAGDAAGFSDERGFQAASSEIDAE